MSQRIEALTDLPQNILVFRCQQETKRFWQKQEVDARYCFALFRKALQNPNTAEAKQTWALIYHNYHTQVRLWVKKHPHFPTTNEEPHYLADLAFEKMWVSFALSPDKFSNFPQDNPDKGLRALLRFLQLCVHSVVMKALTTPSPDVPETATYQTPDPTTQQIFWQCIYQRLSSDKERIVIEALFIQGVKPRHLQALHPNLFTQVKEIYRLKENILNRFKRDASLSHCLETVQDFRFKPDS